jgi:lipoate-protein ligase A
VKKLERDVGGGAVYMGLLSVTSVWIINQVKVKDICFV